MKKDNNEEIFPVVDENGTTVGKATRGECHSGSKLLHPVVHLHLFDSSGRIYLQQRPLWKDIQPGKWDTAVGGHIDYGESVDAALRRETQEELGLAGLSVEFLLKYVFESERERELVHVFRATYDGDVRPSDELDGGRFWSLDELREAFGKGVLTPNFEQEYLKISSLL
ncbi:MAG: NUDIX domain-containing protein [Bacteroidales bacterium]|nr:NUDIX domain-containing protein [Bacteroidales bacterium]